MKTDTYQQLIEQQRDLCRKFGAEYLSVGPSLKLGISEIALKGGLPIHGLRHAPAEGTCGWYIWSGDYSEDPSFFKPLHVEHAISEGAVFAPYLGLSPGWRFLIGEDGYEDIWFDPSLLSEW